jgi:hypothetical protein
LSAAGQYRPENRGRYDERFIIIENDDQSASVISFLLVNIDQTHQRETAQVNSNIGSVIMDSVLVMNPVFAFRANNMK